MNPEYFEKVREKDMEGESARLLRPWDSPGKNTGVGCHFLLQSMKVKSESEVARSCLTLSHPMDCSLPGFSAHGILQARVRVGCHCLLRGLGSHRVRHDWSDLAAAVCTWKIFASSLRIGEYRFIGKRPQYLSVAQSWRANLHHGKCFSELPLNSYEYFHERKACYVFFFSKLRVFMS